jgi:hypothetical protein
MYVIHICETDIVCMYLCVCRVRLAYAEYVDAEYVSMYMQSESDIMYLCICRVRVILCIYVYAE